MAAAGNNSSSTNANLASGAISSPFSLSSSFGGQHGTPQLLEVDSSCTYSIKMKSHFWMLEVKPSSSTLSPPAAKESSKAKPKFFKKIGKPNQSRVNSKSTTSNANGSNVNLTNAQRNQSDTPPHSSRSSTPTSTKVESSLDAEMYSEEKTQKRKLTGESADDLSVDSSAASQASESSSSSPMITSSHTSMNAPEPASSVPSFIPLHVAMSLPPSTETINAGNTVNVSSRSFDVMRERPVHAALAVHSQNSTPAPPLPVILIYRDSAQIDRDLNQLNGGLNGTSGDRGSGNGNGNGNGNGHDGDHSRHDHNPSNDKHSKDRDRDSGDRGGKRPRYDTNHSNYSTSHDISLRVEEDKLSSDLFDRGEGVELMSLSAHDQSFRKSKLSKSPSARTAQSPSAKSLTNTQFHYPHEPAFPGPFPDFFRSFNSFLFSFWGIFIAIFFALFALIILAVNMEIHSSTNPTNASSPLRILTSKHIGYIGSNSNTNPRDKVGPRLGSIDPSIQSSDSSSMHETFFSMAPLLKVSTHSSSSLMTCQQSAQLSKQIGDIFMFSSTSSRLDYNLLCTTLLKSSTGQAILQSFSDKHPLLVSTSLDVQSCSTLLQSYSLDDLLTNFIPYTTTTWSLDATINPVSLAMLFHSQANTILSICPQMSHSNISPFLVEAAGRNNGTDKIVVSEGPDTSVYSYSINASLLFFVTLGALGLILMIQLCAFISLLTCRKLKNKVQRKNTNGDHEELDQEDEMI